MAKKVYIVGGRGCCAYANMFLNAGWEIVDDLLGADLVQFTGGEDVSPYLYGEEKHPLTYNNPQRDLIEAGYFTVAKLLGKPMAGICRGGQFLNVMNGGKMHQHIEGHAIYGTHKVYDYHQDIYYDVTSTHHQVMRPVDLDCIIADDGEHSEVIYYSDTNSLCFQPHPEFLGAGSTREYYFELLERYLGL